MAFPDWLLGHGITTIQVTAQQFSGGVLTMPAGQAPVDFFTVVDRIFYQHRVNLVEVSPTRSRQENMVIRSTGGSWAITERMRRTPSGLGPAHAFNSLASLFHAYDYFRIVFTRAGRSYTQYAVNGGYEEDVGRTGMSVARFEPAGTVETGVAQQRNPSYA